MDPRSQSKDWFLSIARCHPNKPSHTLTSRTLFLIFGAQKNFKCISTVQLLLPQGTPPGDLLSLQEGHWNLRGIERAEKEHGEMQAGPGAMPMIGNVSQQTRPNQEGIKPLKWRFACSKDPFFASLGISDFISSHLGTQHRTKTMPCSFLSSSLSLQPMTQVHLL